MGQRSRVVVGSIVGRSVYSCDLAILAQVLPKARMGIFPAQPREQLPHKRRSMLRHNRRHESVFGHLIDARAPNAFKTFCSPNCLKM